MPWMPTLTQCLQVILTDNNFDSEAKLVTIIAFGDLSLAAGAQNFMEYLPEVLTSFTTASQLSLTVTADPSEKAVLTNLRLALVESYISILHGLMPDDGASQLTVEQDALTEQFALQMWQYLEAMVMNHKLEFPAELLKAMYELYLDICVIHLSKLSKDQQNQVQFRGQPMLGVTILDSRLNQEMKTGICALTPQDQQEIQPRLLDCES